MAPNAEIPDQEGARMGSPAEIQETMRRMERRIHELEQNQRTQAEYAIKHSWQRALAAVREEYTAMPRFAYHLPLDYEVNTPSPVFDPPVIVEGETLPLPPVAERHGLVADDAIYLDWGRHDHDVVERYILRYFTSIHKLKIMDFGCSSGRVMRHFYPAVKNDSCSIAGVDVSARHIEWIRRYFPKEFLAYTGTALPILPFESATFDVIYGMSVFTHIKFLWDMWLLELRRALKPGGLLIQSVHAEYAWKFFYEKSRDPNSDQKSFGNFTIREPELSGDFLLIGNVGESNTFWKEDSIKRFWGRYFEKVEVFPPPERYSYQSWVVCQK